MTQPTRRHFIAGLAAAAAVGTPAIFGAGSFSALAAAVASGRHVDLAGRSHEIGEPLVIPPGQRAMFNGRLVAAASFTGTELLSGTELDGLRLDDVELDCNHVLDVRFWDIATSNNLLFTDLRLKNCDSGVGTGPVLALFNSCVNVTMRGIDLRDVDSRNGIRFASCSRAVLESVVADEITGRLASGEGTAGLVYRKIDIGHGIGKGTLGADYGGEMLYMNDCSKFAVENVNMHRLTARGRAMKLSRGSNNGTVSNVTVHVAEDYDDAGVLRLEGVRDLTVDSFNVLSATPGDAGINHLILVIPHLSEEHPTDDITIKNCVLRGDARGIEVSRGTLALPVGTVKLIDNDVDVTGEALRYGGYTKQLIVEGGHYGSDARVVAPSPAAASLPRLTRLIGVGFAMKGVDNIPVLLQGGDEGAFGAITAIVQGCQSHAPGSTSRSIRFEGDIAKAVATGNTTSTQAVSFSTVGTVVDINNVTY